MDNNERIALLRRRVHYLFNEGNYREIDSAINELTMLGDSTDDIKARLAEIKLRESLSVQHYNNAVHLYKDAFATFDPGYQKALQEVNKALELNPFNADYYYLKRCCEERRPAAIFVDRNEKLSEADKLDRYIRQFALGRYSLEKYQAYCSIKDYGAARRMCANYARELLEENRFDEAERFFCQAFDFESAEKLVPQKRQ